jgi:hypothetical protein
VVLFLHVLLFPENIESRVERKCGVKSNSKNFPFSRVVPQYDKKYGETRRFNWSNVYGTVCTTGVTTECRGSGI